MTESGPVRRTLTVLVVYAAGAFLVLMLGGWLRQILVLPLIFHQLLRWGIYLGAAVAAVVAWHYPTIAAESTQRMDGPGLDRRVEGADPGRSSRGVDPDSRGGGPVKRRGARR